MAKVNHHIYGHIYVRFDVQIICKTAATTVMPLLAAALYIGQFVSPFVVTPIAQKCFAGYPQGAFAVGCVLSVVMLVQVIATRKFQSLPPKNLQPRK